MTQHLLAVVDRFAGTRVAVLADLVLDEFLHGEIARVSREAPVLIVNYQRTDAMPGGGANAVANVRALGGEPVPVGLVGADEPGDRLIGLLDKAGVDTTSILRRTDYRTPTKTRVLAGLPHSRPQQVIRIDRPGAPATAPPEAAAAAVERAEEVLASGVKGVLLSDYGYDLVTPASARPLVDHARRSKVTVTCDSRHRLKEFRGVTAVTPNLEEAEEMLGVRLDDGPSRLDSAGRRLMESLACQAVLITRGPQGMTLLEDGVKPCDIPVFGSDQVADVTGAGDTVIAAFTLALAAGATFRLAAMLANIAAGLVVMKRGTATISAAELRQAIARMPGPESA